MTFRFNFLFPLLLIFFSEPATHSDFDYQLTGNAEDVKPETTEGALMLMGGGGSIKDAYRWFIEKAGGGDIVVLQADRPAEQSGNYAYGKFLHQTVGGCDSVEVINFNDRKASDHPKVLKAIQNAEGIFIAGGKQFRYANYWKGTPVGDALNAHVKAGKPLGGSSAGLAIMGEFCYTAHVTAGLTSERAMRDPFEHAITLESDFLRLDLMKGVFTDSHFSGRGRMGRLIAFLARKHSENKEPQMLGIGVDDRTALCVDAKGVGKIMTTSKDGKAWFVLPPGPPDVLAEGKPLTYKDIKVVAIGTDGEVDLKKRAFTNPKVDSKISVVSGKLLTDDEK